MTRKIIVIIIISSIIYIFFFFRLGNTCYRINDIGEYKLNLVPLISSGFIGPIKSIIELINLNEFRIASKYFIFQLTLLSNPFTAFFATYYIYTLIQNNF